MKRSIRTIAVIATLILAFTLASCASAVEPEVFNEDFLGTSSGIDLEGYEMTYGSDTELSENVLGYEPDTFFADLVHKRLDQVQKDLNCTVTIKKIPNISQAFITASASGSYLADVINAVSDIHAEVARMGMLYGISAISDYIDYRDEVKWGYRYALEVVYYEDDLYAVCPRMWPEIGQDSYGTGIVVNEDIISELALDDPRDYIENGTWTWETFRKCMGDYYVEEGGQVKYYSLASDPGSFGMMFARTNGDKFIEKDASGNYVLGFYSKSAMDAMQESYDIYHKDYAYAIKHTTDATNELINGEAVMGTLNFRSIIGTNGRISKEMKNYGLLSWPTGPEVDPSYRFSQHANLEGNCIGFSKLAKDIDASAQIIDRLYEPFEDYDTPEKLKEYMAHNYFYDPRDCDVFFDMVNNAEYTYFRWGKLRDNSFVFMTSGKSITETMESIRSSFEKETEMYIMPSIRGIIALWGDYE